MGAWHTMVRGAGAGIAATPPMSAVMLASGGTGNMGNQSPERVADADAGAAGLPVRGAARGAAGVVAHLGFGAGVGATYAVLRSRTPVGRVPAGGVAWALVVYAASYLGWIPALRILPPATDDRKDRVTTMVIAHVAFGAAIDRFLATDRPRRRGSA